jgi:hypothetical protein
MYCKDVVGFIFIYVYDTPTDTAQKSAPQPKNWHFKKCFFMLAGILVYLKTNQIIYCTTFLMPRLFRYAFVFLDHHFTLSKVITEFVLYYLCFIIFLPFIIYSTAFNLRFY